MKSMAGQSYRQNILRTHVETAFLRTSFYTRIGSEMGVANFNLSIRKAFPVLYHIPWAALFGGIFVLIGIVFFITRTEIHKLRDKSIIDEIRMDIV